MAAKSIIEIDIDDSKFKAFHALFGKYQEQLAKLPGAWGKTDEAVKETGGSFLDMTAALLAQQELLKLNEERQEKMRREAAATGRSFHDMARDTGSLAKNIGSATASLLKWASLTTVFSGLLGAGGLYGIDRLAISASGQRRTAQGMGLSTAERNAFGINYGRVVDPDSFLGNVNDALHDASKRYIFGANGMGDQDLQGKDTAEVSSALLTRLGKIADQTPDAQMAQVMQARGIDQVMSLEDFQRLKATPESERNRFASDYQRDRGALAVPDETQRAWQDFQVQLSRAGQQIENVFVKDLGPLTPALKDFSARFVEAVDALGNSQNLKIWITDLGDGLKSAAEFIGTQEFRDDVKSFVSGIGVMAATLARWVGTFSDSADGTPAGTTPGVTPLKGDPRSLWYKTMVPGGTDIDKAKFIADQERANGLPSGLLDRTWAAESGRGANPGTSKAGALGDFQFMKGTADQYGVTDRRDFWQSAEGSAKYYHDLLTQFGGDQAKAAAAYNWGPGNLQKDIDTYGADWKKHLPSETQNYVNQVAQSPTHRQAEQSGQITVRIENNTGGNAIVSTSQVAQ